MEVSISVLSYTQSVMWRACSIIRAEVFLGGHWATGIEHMVGVVVMCSGQHIRLFMEVSTSVLSCTQQVCSGHAT